MKHIEERLLFNKITKQIKLIAEKSYMMLI
jgi:hypothetical protein